MSNYNSYALNYQGNNKDKKEKNLSFKLILMIMIVIFMTALITFVFSFISLSENNDNFIKHEIKSGESLWTIASIYHNSNNVDLRKIIYEIKNINNIESSVISPGKSIIIPLD